MKRRIYARPGFVVYGGEGGALDVEVYFDGEAHAVELSALDAAALRTTITEWQRECRGQPLACRNYQPIGTVEAPNGEPVKMSDCYVCGCSPEQHKRSLP